MHSGNWHGASDNMALRDGPKRMHIDASAMEWVEHDRPAATVPDQVFSICGYNCV